MRGWDLADGLKIMGVPRARDVEEWRPDVVVGVCKKRAPKEVEEAVEYRYRPLVDSFVEIDRDAFERVAREVLDLWAEGKRVIVHCLYGRNRSAGVAARALVLSETFHSGAAAVEYVRSIRPNAIANERIEAWLEEGADR